MILLAQPQRLAPSSTDSTDARRKRRWRMHSPFIGTARPGRGKDFALAVENMRRASLRPRYPFAPAHRKGAIGRLQRAAIKPDGPVARQSGIDDERGGGVRLIPHEGVA